MHSEIIRRVCNKCLTTYLTNHTLANGDRFTPSTSLVDFSLRIFQGKAE
jgi:hypothetical protein